MKRAFIIIALVLILIGTVVICAAFAVSGFDFKKLSTVTFESKVHQLSEEVNSLDVSIMNDLRIESSPDGVCRVISYESNRVSHLVSVENGVLKIEAEDKTSFRKWWENISITAESEWVTVQLPEEKYDGLKIKTMSGDIGIVSDLSYGEVTIESTSGDVFAVGEMGSLKVKSTSGDVEISYASVNGNAEVKTTSGDVEIKSTSSSDLQIRSTSGEIELDDVKSAGNLSIKTTSGDIELDGCSADESVTLESTSGDIGGKLVGSWSFITDTKSGNVRLPIGSSEKECRIKTTSGNIYFR